MKQILILCRRDDRESYDTGKSMLDGLGKLETKATYMGADYEDLLFHYDGSDLHITDTVSGRDIADFDAIFLIGWFYSGEDPATGMTASSSTGPMVSSPSGPSFRSEPIISSHVTFLPV